MARHHRRRFHIRAPYGWDFDGTTARGWIVVAAALIVSIGIVWAAM
jgi:hypothetical protein